MATAETPTPTVNNYQMTSHLLDVPSKISNTSQFDQCVSARSRTKSGGRGKSTGKGTRAYPVYGGFATAQQEAYYLKMLEKTLKMITDRLTAFYRHEAFRNERKWAHSFRKSYKALHLMEKHKNSDQKFSVRLRQLQVLLREVFVEVSSEPP